MTGRNVGVDTSKLRHSCDVVVLVLEEYAVKKSSALIAAYGMTMLSLFLVVKRF